VNNAVIEVGGCAPDFPADSFFFEEKADRMVGSILLELMSGVDRGGEVAGVDLVENRLGGGRDVEVLRARKIRIKERDKEDDERGAKSESGRHWGRSLCVYILMEEAGQGAEG